MTHGDSLRLLWSSSGLMESYGGPGESRAHLRAPRVSWGLLETLEDFWGFLGSPWDSKDLIGTPRDLGTLEDFLGTQRDSWDSFGLLGTPGDS